MAKRPPFRSGREPQISPRSSFALPGSRPTVTPQTGMSPSMAGMADPKFQQKRETLSRAIAAARASDHISAIAILEDFLKKHSRDPDALLMIGGLCNTLNDFKQASLYLKRALKSAPNIAEINYNYGIALTGLRRPEEALRALDEALRLKPDMIAAAVAKARLLAEQDGGPAAQSLIERILQADPTNSDALTLRGIYALNQKDNVSAKADFETALASTQSSQQRARLHHELGVLADKRGDTKGALASFVAMNEAAADHPNTKILSTRMVEERIAAVRDVFKTGIPDATFAPFDRVERPAPIFIMGFPRSGTTLIERVLASYPGIATSDEFSWVEKLADECPKHAKELARYPACLAGISMKQRLQLRRAYWAKVREDLPDLRSKETLVDKFPLNLIDLPFVRALFPEAKIIIALRDPRDVCLSNFMQNFRLNKAMIHMLSLERAAMFYRSVMHSALLFREGLPGPFHTVRYEDVVADFEPTIRSVLEFLELPWDPAVLDYHKAAKTVSISTPSARDVRSPIFTRASGRWRRYENALQPIQPILAPFVEQFGYEL